MESILEDRSAEAIVAEGSTLCQGKQQKARNEEQELACLPTHPHTLEMVVL